MLNLKFADAYVELSLRTGPYDAGMKRVQNELRRFPGTQTVTIQLQSAQFSRQMVAVRAELAKLRSFPIRMTVDRAAASATLNLLRQQITALTGRRGQRIVFAPDLRYWRRGLVQVFTDLGRVRAFAATIPIRVNATAAHARVNLLMQQLRAAQALTRFQIQVQRPAGGLGLGALGLGGGGGRMGGGGFVTGLGMGLGLPFAMNPQMMAGNLLGSALTGTVRTATQLEGEFATLRRITGMTADQLERFKSDLMGMATTRPGVSTQDLIEMAQVGGRAGVAEREGPQGLLTFTEQLSRVKMVISDMPTEDLANQIGRVLNVFELGTNRVASFGSALTAMDNISTASARDILDITQRLSGTAKAIGLTIPQVVSLSSVLKDVGLSNEVAGSAFSQIFRKMASDADKFSEQIGVDARAFADAYRRDPMEALEMVIAKFREMTDTVKGQELLAGLGLRGVRTAGALQQLASKFPEVGRRAGIASAETGSLAALGGAEGIMSQTTGASFQRARNSVTDLADAAGTRLAPLARGAANALGDVAGALASIIRGTNQTSFAAPAKVAAAALGALPAKPNNPVIPQTVEDAQEAVKAAQQRAAAAEDTFNARDKAARQAGFQGRQAMAGAAGFGADSPQWHAAEALMRDALHADELAKGAAGEMQAAGDALRDAMGRLTELERQKAEADRQAAARNALPNLIAQGQGRLGNVLAAVGDVRRGVVGAGMQALAKIFPQETNGQAQRHYSAGLTGSEVGERIQEDILNPNKARAQEDTAKNTKDAVTLLGELRDILKEGANKVRAGVLAQ